MEQARCWLVSNRIMPAECGGGGDDSWEERAFAEDTSGVLGGCVWPPRSYSCNFCRREFRSAQALGGHMNVHRRDRARLKLMSTSAKSHLLGDQKSYGGHHHLHNNNNNSNQDVAIIDQNPSLFASSNNNIPKSQFIPSFVVSNNHHEKTLSFFCLNSSNDDEKDKDFVVPFKIAKNHEIKDTYSPFIGLSTSLTLVANDDDEDDDMLSTRNKRRKVVDTSSSSPIVMITKKVKDQTTKVNDDDAHEIEELDLELRLGDRPKIQ